MESAESKSHSFRLCRFALKTLRVLTVVLVVPAVLLWALLQAKPELWCSPDDLKCLDTDGIFWTLAKTYLFAAGLLLFSIYYRRYPLVRAIASACVLVPIVHVLAVLFDREVGLGSIGVVLILCSIPLAYLMLLSLPNRWLPRCLR